MPVVPRQRSADGSILFLPDELVERICVQAVEERLGCHQPLEFHHMSKICRRIRIILLPRIYRDVFLHNKGQFPFLLLTPAYGHLCRSITLSISGSSPQIFTLFTPQCANLTRLQVLRLHIQSNENSSAVNCLSSRGRKQPVAPAMNFARLTAWKRVCAVLPRVSELHLHGFTWSDIAEGFKGAGAKPGIIKLCLDLTASASLEAAHIQSHIYRTYQHNLSDSLVSQTGMDPACLRSSKPGEHQNRSIF
jgi:hypothetical protein